MIIAFVGKFASGKSEAADYISKNYGGEKFKFSQPLRDVIKRLYLEENIDNLSKLSEALRSQFGEDILAQIANKEIDSYEAEIKIAEGVLRLQDIKYLRKASDFYLVSVTANDKTRFNRMRDRKENAQESTKSFEKFKQQEHNSSNETIPQVMKQADYTLENNGTLEEFHQKIDNLMKQLRNGG